MPRPDRPSSHLLICPHTHLDSTMDEARRSLAAPDPGPLPRVIVADTQQGGRGRFGRPWQSPPGGLWCTLLWPLPADPTPLLAIAGLETGLASAAAIDAALRRAGVATTSQLKWPNDVLVNGRKVAGILCETADDVLLVGVGVNCDFDRDRLPPDLADRADTLRSIAARPVDRDALLADLLDHLHASLSTPRPLPAVATDVRARLAGVGREADITLPDGARIRGVLLDLDDAGRARVRTDQGIRILPSGSLIATSDASDHPGLTARE